MTKIEIFEQQKKKSIARVEKTLNNAKNAENVDELKKALSAVSEQVKLELPIINRLGVFLGAKNEFGPDSVEENEDPAVIEAIDRAEKTLKKV